MRNQENEVDNVTVFILLIGFHVKIMKNLNLNVKSLKFCWVLKKLEIMTEF